jgi:uncharacterized protein YjiS (DUF1127 family)
MRTSRNVRFVPILLQKSPHRICELKVSHEQRKHLKTRGRCAGSPELGQCARARVYERRLQRKALLDLDARLLRDIGITREQAEQEASRPFW